VMTSETRLKRRLSRKRKGRGRTDVGGLIPLDASDTQTTADILGIHVDGVHNLGVGWRKLTLSGFLSDSMTVMPLSNPRIGERGTRLVPPS